MVETAGPVSAAGPDAGATAGATISPWWAALLAFAASGGTLVLELVAGRMLAPYVGASLYTWTSIIGLILAGISLGNWLGGRLADRRASGADLGALFVLGGLAAALTLGLVAGLGPLSRGLPL